MAAVLEQGLALATEARSRRSVQRPPLERMEPIAEEKDQLIEQVAEALMDKLDVDRKIDERVRDMLQCGDRIVRDVQARQVRQEQSSGALLKLVENCLENQRMLQEEGHRLSRVISDLGAIVMPSSFSNQAFEAHAQAIATMAEQTEALKHVLDENHRALAATAVTPARLPAPQMQVPAPPGLRQETRQFNITLRKADDVNLGLSVKEDAETRSLVVESVASGGAVETWNRQCIGDGSHERVVAAGDRIICVNGVEQDVAKMLEACTAKRLVKLLVVRGPRDAAVQSIPNLGAGATSPQTVERQSYDAALSAAPLPRPDASPLKHTQHQAQQLTPPPGFFFWPDDGSNVAGQVIAQQAWSIQDDMIAGSEK